MTRKPGQNRDLLDTNTLTLRQLPGRLIAPMHFHSRRRILPYALLAMVVSLLVLGLRPPVLNEADQVARDRVFRWRESPHPHPDVAVVAVDQYSVERIGRWPWSRTRQASLIRRLKEAGAGTIALDIAYLHPESEPADTALAAALRHTVDGAGTVPVVGGYFFRDQSATDRQVGSKLLLRRLKLDAVPGISATVAGIDPDAVLRRAAFAFPHVEVVQPGIADHLAALGFFNILPEQDGRVRKLPLIIRHGEPDATGGPATYYPALTLQALAVFLSPHRAIPRDLALEAEGELWLPFREAINLRVGHEGLTGIQLGERSIPVDHHGQFNLNFYHTRRRAHASPLGEAVADPEGILIPNRTGLPFISAATVMDTDDPIRWQAVRQALAGKLVFVGLVEQGIADFQPTPVTQQFPGVAIQATAASNILANQYLHHGSDALLLTVGLTAGLPLVTVFMLAKARKPTTIGLLALAALLLPFTGFLYMALAHSTLLGFVYPTVGGVVAIFCYSAYHVRVSQEKTRHLVTGFGKFLSPALVDEFLNDTRWRQQGANREPEEREITVLFSDIRGFTGISEKIASATRLFGLLNRYLGEMAAIVKEHDGHLDKFIGDAVMAIYNAPVAHTDHAARAALTALAMQRRLAVINPGFRQRFEIDLRIGIGLHSGPASVGNVGNDHHLEYTALGDTVNQASRLEGATKRYGVEILITDATRRQLGERFLCREVDTVIFKGKEQSAIVHELMSDRPEPRLRALRDAYEAALADYRAGNFEAALAGFSRIVENPDTRNDGPSLLMVERCLNFMQTPPTDWQGVSRLAEK